MNKIFEIKYHILFYTLNTNFNINCYEHLLSFPQCVICVNSKATMQTWPCGHRVVCRKCLVRTIQIAVSRRSLPLRCVVCRARVLRLKRSSDGRTSAAPADAAGTGGRRVTGASEPATSVGRSHSLPTKLRRNTAVTTAAAASVEAVRSQSVGTGKPGHRRRQRRRSRQSAGRVRGKSDDIAAAIRATGWAAGTDDEDDNGNGYHSHGYRDHSDHDRDDGHDQHTTTTIKYR